MTTLNANGFIVNAVVDSLALRLQIPGRPTPFLLDALARWRSFRDSWDGREELYQDLPGLGTFRVLPTSRPYEFKLIHPTFCDIRIWNPDKWLTSFESQTGQFYIDFRSKFLQFADLADIKKALVAIESLFVDIDKNLIRVFPPFTLVSRGDLAADTIDFDSGRWSDFDRYLCRARARDYFVDPYGCEPRELEKQWSSLSSSEAHKGNKAPSNTQNSPTISDSIQIAMAEFAQKHRNVKAKKGQARLSWVKAKESPETVYFGRFGSKLYCRRYNKRLACLVQKKTYMFDVWAANGWDMVSPVWRTEFSLSREFLRAFRINGEVLDLSDLDNFWSHRGEIWSYLTHEWMRHCDLGDPNHKERWEISDLWASVQTAFLPEKTYKRISLDAKPVLDQLIAQVEGLSTSIASKVAGNDDDLSGAQMVLNLMYEHFTSPLYLNQQKLRRQKFGMNDFSDYQLSTLVRAEKMCEGLGS
ncbi:MAG TPA: hypothetical protein V6C97_26455 [Oculatellaceae cyanobacterium]